MASELPADAVRAAERLTRLARRATDEAEAAAYREERAERLAAHGYDCRVREEGETSATLVCYPAAWLDDGTADLDAVEDTDRAVEVSLAGPGDPEAFDDVAEHNRAVAREVRERHGDVHGENAAALAAFASNHYAKEIEALAARELQEFAEEFFPRNAFPSDAQERALDASLNRVYDVLDRERPDRD